VTANGWLQLGLYLAVLLALVKPLGRYMARVYEGKPCGIDRFLAPLERRIYRVLGIQPTVETGWRPYALAMLTFNLVGLLAVYLLQRFQAVLPLNPAGLPGVAPDLAFNTAVSFASNTNWQSYSGETTLSHLVQMAGLTVQNFVSAATGMAILVALIRGLVRRETGTIGNFWVDITRTILYILFPLALVLSLLLVSQGVVQTLGPSHTVPLLDPVTTAAGGNITDQTISVGPAASQVAIKQLGTNGGGFFGVNSAHPFENPTPFSNFLEMLSILLIPAALCYTYGRMIRDRRQGWAILGAMTLLFVPLLLLAVWAEQGGSPAFPAAIDQRASEIQAGGNMEGKEVRFGIVNSALWASATTAASNGSVNSMHDSYTPLGGLVPMWLIQVGEVVYGGVGSGLYGMVLFVILAVFTAGLMVGRTPEYLGKKIEAFEMKMAVFAVLVPAFAVLLGSSLAAVSSYGLAGLNNAGPHGLSEILYAFSSAGNNNGSAFAGLGTNTPFYNLTLGLAMLFARYWVALPALAIAGSLSWKTGIAAGPGTLPTHTPLFVVLLAGTVVIVGALTFFPALALGPVVEHLILHAS
jgi:K+-transporting ATPase ATPase A chain